MKEKVLRIFFFLTVLAVIGIGQEADAQIQIQEVWTSQYQNLGVYSSPRVADLNQDGTKDIILGAGRQEFEATDSAVVAINGMDGSMLWNVGARDQMFGSATLLDVSQDSVPDIFISGRSAELKGINGETGKVMWEFYEENDPIPSAKGYYNFYNPQAIPDQNGDGVSDLLVSNGGDVNAAPDDSNRPPGYLMIIDAQNGTLLAKAPMPDGRETYMSPVVAQIHPADQEYTVIFGTGGETIGGRLYRTTIEDVMRQDLSDAIVLDSSQNKGYIAPPVLADITEDDYLDIIANAVEGKIIAVNGQNNRSLWSQKIPGAEAYNSIAVGYFNKDSIPDFFTGFSKGVWPDLPESDQLMIDGKTGDIVFQDSLGMHQTSSAVVADFNSDGFDDGLMSINIAIIKKQILKFYHNLLVVFDFKSGKTYQLTDYAPGVNLASTPWVGDLDDDGKLDIIYCSLTEDRNIFAMDGFKVSRISTNIKLKHAVRWGAYMGSGYNGIFK
ncbi:PQQ-binding-like beta-propeller repeat protein [Fodinibius salsisoli]|uniref:PQQ-binding-like beta-propeller repeat protein n=1 Tax=Fodinibius salsisoli TaxID=2820877 RepID=A0ABT3PLR3_9BACT|nr:PQQ-binding-like beta-propeller repeat protein [Fodinibius salsisoli]MCW9706894.1 PQQ-binding-like beta-propeller repeat protein [Fodinibius salsisoli]